jgi:glucokinase
MRHANTLLVADLGGTNLRLALVVPAAAPVLRLQTVKQYSIRDYGSFSAAADHYLGWAGQQFPELSRPRVAVIAVAGRIESGRVSLTNHDWVLDQRVIASELGLDQAQLINDFAAISQCLTLLGQTDVEALGPSVSPIRRRSTAQVFCAMGPGTGLGVSALCLAGDQQFQLATEGGHISFAPQSDEEILVLRFLMQRFGRVSVERLLCGSGMVNLYQALAHVAGATMASAADAAAITSAALADSDPLATRTVRLFCRMLGSVAGDYVLAFGAWQGLYLAGGMTAHLAPYLGEGAFRNAFEDKGRFADAIRHVPVAIITHPQPGLLGAAAQAMTLAGHDVLALSGDLAP